MLKKVTISIIVLVAVIFATTRFLDKNSSNVTVVTFQTLQLSPFSKYFDDVSARFEAQNPGVKIKIIDVPYSEGEKRTLASLLSGNPPDLINLNPDFSMTAAKKNALWELPPSVTENFPDILRSDVSYNGKIFALPFYLTSAVTFANVDLMRKFAISKVPATYSELFEISKKISDKNVYAFMPLLSENDYLLKVARKEGIDVFDENACLSVKNLFENYKILFDAENIPKESLTSAHREALEKYMAGQTLFFSGGVNFLKLVAENAPETEKNTRIFPQITGKTGSFDYSVMTLIIPSKAKNKDAALKFALFLTDEENQLEFAKLTGVLPANKKALENPYFSKQSTKEEYARYISADQIKHARSSVKKSSDDKKISELLNYAAGSFVSGKSSNSASEFCTKVNNLK